MSFECYRTTPCRRIQPYQILPPDARRRLPINVYYWRSHVDEALFSSYHLALVVPAKGPIANLHLTPGLINTRGALWDGDKGVSGVWGAQGGLANAHIDGVRF